MPIITLTSDFGDSSHYSAIVKGVIYSLISDVTLTDVTDTINDFDIITDEFKYYTDNTLRPTALLPSVLEIKNSNGVLIKAIGLSRLENQITVNTQEMNPGIYIIALKVNGHIKETAKFILIN